MHPITFYHVILYINKDTFINHLSTFIMTQYYISIDGENTLGPFTKDQLLYNGLTPYTLVWCEGMEDWQQAYLVPDLEDTLANAAQQEFQPYSDSVSGFHYLTNDNEQQNSYRFNSYSDDSDSGCGGWAIWLGLIIIINILSAVFDWNFWVW